METLKINQRLVVNGVDVVVRSGGLQRYWLENPSHVHDNTEVFKMVGIRHPQTFVKNILGYNGEGLFPEVKSLKDLTKVVIKLDGYNSDEDEEILMFTSHQYTKYIDKACHSWKKRLFNLYAEDLLFNGKAILDMDLLKQMIEESNETQLEILKSLFPKYFTQNIDTYASELEIGQAIEIDGEIILRTFTGFVNLNDPSYTWSKDNTALRGKLVEFEIVKKS